ncbi:MAG: OPT/YSL family transporter [Aeoliella sp.]
MKNPQENYDAEPQIDFGTSGDSTRLWPALTLTEWAVFALLAAVLVAANIYTTLLIGWGDTGSIIAVLASVVLLGIFSRRRPSVHVLNLGQTMASAGGSVGFAVASYAAVHIVRPDFAPPTPLLIVMFFAMGLCGAIVGSSVRQYMVRYFFPSGTACAVIQTSVSRVLAPGERNRPVWMLKLWGGIAAILSLPTKISLSPTGEGVFSNIWLLKSREVGVAVDPLYYGIGIMVGPRIGVGMILGALAVPFLITDSLAGTQLAAETGDWIKWIAIAVLTLPTFATIVFAYLFHTPPVIPPGFHPGRTTYTAPASRAFVFGILGVVAAVVIAVASQQVFGLPWHICIITMAIAWPLCVVNGRVTGDTDINPVRLVAIVLLSGFFWLFSAGAGATIAMLGMAVVGGTLAAVAVDMMQDYRTGYLVDANPTHQTSVQFVGALFGALAAIPVLNLLLGQLGIGPDSSLPAPGAQVWAAMAEAMSGGFEPSRELIWIIVTTSIVGSLYAFFTVWPVTARWMPSIFGLGIGMLVGVPASAASFIGGLIKWAVELAYRWEKTGDKLTAARQEATNDTMLAGASVFAAGAVVSIAVVLLKTILDAIGVEWFNIAH